MERSVNRFCLLLALLAPLAGIAAPDTAIVAQVPDGKTLVLEDDRIVRLAGIETPDAAAQAELRRLVQGKTVTLMPIEKQPDRHGRVVALAFDATGHSVQEAMLHAGIAVVDGILDNAGFLSAEREAEREKRGIWTNPSFVIPAENAAKCAGQFRIVEGTVQHVAEKKNATYLNFGEDWKTDFTLTVDQQTRTRSFKGFDFKELEGKTIRARGWIYKRNGPMVDLIHPRQIEVLTASGRRALLLPEGKGGYAAPGQQRAAAAR
jgi:micrococcal nuclease